MQNKILKFTCIPIYLFYSYLFIFQVHYLNFEVYSERQLGEENNIFSRYMPSIILLLYGVLLYSNIILKQRRLLVLNSFFAASLLYMYNTTTALITAVLLSIFGLAMAAVEIKRTNNITNHQQ
jgi:hypothetical protein